MNNSDNKLFDDLLKSSNGKIDREAISNAAKNGDASKLVNNLSTEDKQKLNQILNDKDALNQILKSPQAMALMKMFKRGGKDG